MASKGGKRKPDLKIVILGAASIGKTTLIHRYIHGSFQHSISTIGASFSLKQWGPFNVAVWDTAGEERFSGLSSFYSRGAGAAILAYDVTNEDSFHALRARFIPLLQSAEENCLCVVVATKMDLLSTMQRQVSVEDAIVLAKEVNSARLTEIPFIETSSLSGQNVNRVFEYILQTRLPLDSPEKASVRKRASDVIDLDSTTTPVAESIPRGKCC